LGMWVFLATEVLFFGGLFMAYIAYRFLYPNAFAEGSRHLNVWLGSTNTAVLLCSSLTMALAVHSVRVDNRKLLVIFLLATMLLGILFLGIKAIEYYVDYQEHLIPALNFSVEGPDARQVEIFFLLYFFMTGLHAIHLIIGVCIIALMAFLAWRNHFSAERYMPVEITGLYWHFIDIVWVFLFPLLYLVDLHT
ncbi:MAG: cytochrome c oxidase subunit 3 family protein, partial [Chloroflexi bacterium]|nr:cytochrome c oxidase subunit 3 family protein [Chloroflexota bacterium]